MKTLLGEKLCGELGLDFPETFARQFVIAESLPALPATWSRVALGRWHIAHCPDLPRIELEGREGLVAVVLGIAVTEDGVVLQGRRKAEFADWSEAETYIEKLSGRFLAIARMGSQARLYVDPSCSLAPLYEPETRSIGSCLPLVLTRGLEDNPWLPLAQYNSAENQFYLFGETADARVRRMLGNHYLDLSSFREVRHYPKPDVSFENDRRHSDMLDELIALLSVQMGALIRSYRCALPITGGGDSRILLASASAWLDGVAEFFCHVNNYTSMLDSIVAVSIAEAAGVPLRLVNVETPRNRAQLSPERCATLREMIALRTSFQIRPDDQLIRVLEQAPRADLTLRGGLVEMTRSNKWPKRPVAVTPREGAVALARPLKMPEAYTEAVTSRYAEWLDTLPDGARPRAFDFGHVELWMPTIGNTFYNGVLGSMMLNPFNNRQILTLTTAMDPFFRKTGRPQRYILRHCMPDLARIPYAGRAFGRSLYGADGVRDLISKMGRLL